MSRWLLLCLLPAALMACSSQPPEAPLQPAAVAAQGTSTGLCEHGVPTGVCTQCNPEVIPVFKSKGDWCGEHGVPESHCFACNPTLTFATQAAPASDWCGEHGVPESRCTRCNPELITQYIQAGDYCREHGFPQSICPICKGENVFPPPGMKVRLASASTAKDVGIETTQAKRRPFGTTLEAVGVLAFDPNRSAELTAVDEAIVRKIHVDVGDVVEKGAPLVTLASERIGGARASLASARSLVDTARLRVEREEALHDQGISSRADVEQARQALAEATAALASSRSALDTAGAGAGKDGTYVLRSPLAGIVAARAAVVGHATVPGDVLVHVANVESLWALLELPQAQAGKVFPGQSVSIRLEGDGGDTRHGTIAAVSPAIDPRTRTVRARVVLENAGGALKAGAFVRASIAMGGNRQALVIPRAAVQQGEGNQVVFVQEQPGVYRPVAVRLGEELAGEVEIVSGLEEGDEVVSTGAFLLATETRKDAIGAGCCEVD